MKCCVLMGAKDGVGTTTLAVTLAALLTRQSRRVLLCEWDAAHVGDVALALGVSAVRGVREVVRERARLFGDGLTGYCRCHPDGLGAVARDADTDPAEAIPTLVAMAQDRYDVLLVDAGSRFDPAIAAWCGCASHFLVICRPDLAVVAAAERWLARLREGFVPRHRTLVCCNHCTADGAIAPAGIAERLGHDVAPLPSAEAIFAAWHLGIPLAIAEPRHPFVAAVEEMLSRFLDATEGTPPPAVVVHRWFPALPHALQESPSSIAPAAAEAEPLRAEILAALTRAIDREGAARVTPRADTQAALRRTVERHCVTLLDRMPPERLVGIDRQEFMASVLADAVGLGPLEPLLADRTVSEILVNGPAQVFAERGGRLTPAPEAVFRSAEHLLRIIERIVAPTGRRVDESTPMVDARLADGSRVNVVLTPIALEGPVLSIRRFPAERLTMADLLALGSVTPRIATRLTAMVRERKNCLIAGGTGTGKTTLLCILSADIPAEERIITIEDAAELQLQQPHVVRMEARPPNIEGAGAIAIRDLVRNALRMRPDRIVVGECRGAEALDMLQAMNTGHDGSLTTIHANSPKDALHRLETLVMFAGMDLPSHAIREQIVGAIQIVIQLARLPDGRRQVAQVVRVAGLRNGEILLEDAI